jgi:flagellum-specific peptidoglycan hydrolase FlgJ/LysM repeat protein
MHIKTLIIIQIILVVSFTSCRSSKPLASSVKKEQRASSPNTKAVTATGSAKYTAPKSGSPEDLYISKYSDLAISEMKRTGVPASITLAQGMLESDYGRSRLAYAGNNHFGIKCANWDGGTVYHNDDKRNDCFRKYPSVEESFYDHSNFLKNGSRYSFLFQLPPTDYKAWAHGLKKAGYATNPDYANLLIRKIEENNLDIFDKGYVASKTMKKNNAPDLQAEETVARNKNVQFETAGFISIPPRIQENNRVQYIIVRDGETREKIEKEFKLLRWELAKYNELKDEFDIVPGQILYLQPKRDKAEPGKETYTVKDGDTVYSISQKFGIKMKSIYDLNRLAVGSEIKPGTKIWLRSMKPVS